MGPQYADWAGAGIVHMSAGFAALVGAILMGARTGRFTGLFDTNPAEFAPCDITRVCMGTLFLWFSWYGMNAGSTMGLSNGMGPIAARCATTTTLAGASGGIASFCLAAMFMVNGYDMLMYCQGIIGGLVASSACCHNIDTPSALFIGCMAGCITILTMKLLAILHIDDPCGVFACHGMCGLWGVIAMGLFDMSVGSVGAIPSQRNTDQLYIQIQGASVIIWYACAASALVCGVMGAMGMLRCSEEEEEDGLDTQFAALAREVDVSLTKRPMPKQRKI